MSAVTIIYDLRLKLHYVTFFEPEMMSFAFMFTSTYKFCHRAGICVLHCTANSKFYMMLLQVLF